MARAFVRSPKGWAAITAVADALFERGRVDGDEIDVFCSEAFSIPFRYGAWDNTWPPTPGQIRSGFIPDRSSTAPA